MLTAFGRAFKTPDLRRKLLFTLGIILLFRLGSHVPTPGIDYPAVQQCLAGADNTGGFLGLVNLFSGGALLQLSIFALGIMPYITASIIIQLLTVVIPRFETLKKEGQSGQTKMTQYTRYLTIGLAILQSSTLITFAQNPVQLFGNPSCTNILVDDSIVTILIMVLTMTAGTGLIMWLGELITDKGIGNGMSLLIFTSIAARFPSSLWQIQTQSGWSIFLGVILMGFVVIAAVVFVEQSQRRIPVQYAKRMVGRKVYGGTSTYIPLKVNMAGVIPVIFASSLLALPGLLAQFNRNPDGTAPGWVNWIQVNLVRGDHPIYMVALHGAHPLLHVLLRVHHVQPHRGRRRHEAVRRLHPGYPRRATHGRVPRLRPQPDHRPRCDLPRGHLAHPAHRPGSRQREPELPLRRHLDPHRRRCRPRDGQADRGPAAAAAL